PFGGINVLFTGDFGQLKGAALHYSHQLLRQIMPQTSQSNKGQDALLGTWYWKQVKEVVILQWNVRQNQ
ncbi:hypothetical protein DACRYDRAFT_35650, partial [Dacryopinax primogenitus]